MDLRKPGEEEDQYSEMAEEAMDPENCLPDGRKTQPATPLLSWLWRVLGGCESSKE